MGAAFGALVLAGPGFMVAHAWAVIVAAGALFVLWPNPLTYLLAVMLIGARQLGLAILMHEAAHGGLHPNLKVNDWVGEWLCAAPTGASLAKYRPYHLTHHKYAQQAEDPDLVLSAPFPTTRPALRRKIVRDLTGQTFFKQRFGPLLGKLKGDSRRARSSAARSRAKSRSCCGIWACWSCCRRWACGGRGWRCGSCRWRPGSRWSPACATSPSTPWWPRTSPTRSATPAPPAPTGSSAP
jgi:fatty acid desaturase